MPAEIPAPLTAQELPEARRVYEAVQKQIGVLQSLNAQLAQRIKSAQRPLSLHPNRGQEVTDESVLIMRKWHETA